MGTVKHGREGGAMKWCCGVFRGWFEQAGTRGFSVFSARQQDSSPTFIMQFRALDPGKQMSPTMQVVSLVSEIHIKFCPWCGVNLRSFYTQTAAQLERPDLRVP